jgi:hypothetical protein
MITVFTHLTPDEIICIIKIVKECNGKLALVVGGSNDITAKLKTASIFRDALINFGGGMLEEVILLPGLPTEQEFCSAQLPKEWFEEGDVEMFPMPPAAPLTTREDAAQAIMNAVAESTHVLALSGFPIEECPTTLSFQTTSCWYISPFAFPSQQEAATVLRFGKLFPSQVVWVHPKQCLGDTNPFHPDQPQNCRFSSSEFYSKMLHEYNFVRAGACERLAIERMRQVLADGNTSLIKNEGLFCDMIESLIGFKDHLYYMDMRGPIRAQLIPLLLEPEGQSILTTCALEVETDEERDLLKNVYSVDSGLQEELYEDLVDKCQEIS